MHPEHWKASKSAYRAAESHWYQRLYGLFSGQPAFGDDWLPIYSGYEGLYAGGRFLEIGCWAHARRRFIDAFLGDTNAALMIALIQQL